MERTLVIIKPSALNRGLVGEIITRFEKKGLVIVGLKMMQLTDAILNEHYAHLKDRSFFTALKTGMMITPVIAMCVQGVEAVSTVREMTGATNGRHALPGTIRGDYSMSMQENIIHTSDAPETAVIELNRFFKPEEIFDYKIATFNFLYTERECQ